MQNLSFEVNQKVLDLGVKIQTLRISNLTNSKSDSNFVKYQNSELESLKKCWKNTSIEADSILQGFRDLHTKVGRSNRKFVSSPESLIWLLKEKDRFPQINTLVDIYNLISIKYKLALGAHDISKIKGNITLKITNSSEKFIPLGTSVKEKIFPDVFLIIQGNQNTPIDYMENAIKELIELIKNFCGGEATYLNKLS